MSFFIRKYLLFLLLIPSISWSEIILNCYPTNKNDAANRLVWTLDLEEEILDLKNVFLKNGKEMEVTSDFTLEIFDISNEIIFFYDYDIPNPNYEKIEWRLNTKSLELTNHDFSPNDPQMCTSRQVILLPKQSNSMKAIKECADLGFTKGTDKFMNCVLELSE